MGACVAGRVCGVDCDDGRIPVSSVVGLDQVCISSPIVSIRLVTDAISGTIRMYKRSMTHMVHNIAIMVIV